MSDIIKPVTPKRQPLGFVEGFNFGLGFWVAGFFFLVIGVPILTVIGFIALTVIGGSLGN